jgi:hypothetical protein
MLVGLVLACAAAAQAPGGAAPYHPPAKRVSPADGLVATAKSAAPTPRRPDGHPDLTGMWEGQIPSPAGRYGNRSLATLEPDQATMQRGNAWSKPIYKPELWQKVYDTDYSKVDVDPSFNCLPLGAPRMGAPKKIVQTDKEIVTYNPMNAGSVVRFIPIDGRKRDAGDSDYDNYAGMPLAHWDGDTLVIESIGFNDISWLQWQGYFHSAQMKLTETLRRQGDLLFYQFTVDDPDVLAEPWTSATYVRRLNTNPLARAEEVAPCKEQDLGRIEDLYYRG